jgi:hypothetical protein
MLADAHFIDGTALTGPNLDSAVEFVLHGWTHCISTRHRKPAC